MNQQVSPAFWQAVEQFNQQQFYACHDTLEALWFESSDPLKTFYQGILQIAVALHHLENANWRGAAILLGEGMRKLKSLPSDYAGIDIIQLIQQSAEVLNALQQGAPDWLAEPAGTLTSITAAEQYRPKLPALPRILRISPGGDRSSPGSTNF